jgi:hypothetical protein
MDPEIVKHLRLILFGKMDYPQVYRYADGGSAYNSYMAVVNSSGLVKQKEAELLGLQDARKRTEKRTPERIKIDKKINKLGLEMANITGGLSYYWVRNMIDKRNPDNNKEERERALASIAQQKFDVFIEQLSEDQREDFRENYTEYLGFNEGSIGFSPTGGRRAQMLGGEQVADIYLANEGRQIVLAIIANWANPGA